MLKAFRPRPDYVIHLASYPRAKLVNADPMIGVQNVIGGTVNILWHADKMPVKKVVFVSSSMIYGHFKDGTIDFDWPKIIAERQTLVIYMGLLSLDEMKNNLIKHGMKKNMPIAVVQRGTTNKQRVVIGELKNIKSKVSKANIESPALIIIGTVVELRKDLSWFD